MSDFEKRIQRVQAKENEAQLEKLERDKQLELKALSLGREVADYLLRNNIEPKPYWEQQVIGQVYEPAHIAKSAIRGEYYAEERYYDRTAFVIKGRAWHIYTQTTPEGYDYERGGITTESLRIDFGDYSRWPKDDGSLLTDTDLAMKPGLTSFEYDIKVMESDLFAKAVNHLVQTGNPYRSSDIF